MPPTLEVREVVEARNLFNAGGGSTKQTPDHLSCRIPLLGNQHNAGMPPALAQSIPVKLREVAHVRCEKQAVVTCRKAELRIIALAVHARLKRRQHVKSPGPQCPNKLAPRHVFIEIERYHAGGGRPVEDAAPSSYARASASISASISALFA